MKSEMKRRYQSSFREEWLQDENYNEWLQKVDSDECMCKCRICSNSFTVKYDGVEVGNKLKINFDGNELYNEFFVLKSVVSNLDRKELL